MTKVKLRRVTGRICGLALAFTLSATAQAQVSTEFVPHWVIRNHNLIENILLLILAVAAFRWWRNRKDRASGTRKIAVVDDGFQITPSADGKSTRFEIKGAGIGMGAWVGFILGGIFFGFFFSLIMYIIYRTRDPATFTNYGLFLAACLMTAFVWDRIRKRQFAFEVNDTGVRAPDGQLYAKVDISEILLRNRGATAYAVPPQSTMVVGGTGVAGVTLAAAGAAGNISQGVGQAVGMAVSESLKKRSNEVCIRHGRKIVPLAKHLKEDDAIALFNKVRELI